MLRQFSFPSAVTKSTFVVFLVLDLTLCNYILGLQTNKAGFDTYRKLNATNNGQKVNIVLSQFVIFSKASFSNASASHASKRGAIVLIQRFMKE